MKLINPATEDVFEEITANSKEDVHNAYARSCQIQKKWQQTSFSERKAYITKFMELLNAEKLTSAELLSQEMGKPQSQAEAEINATISRVQWFVDNVEQHLQKNVKIDAAQLNEFITWEPLGVVGHISAWNFPYFIGTNVIIPALLTGNTVLYKPSEITSLTGLYIGDLMKRSGLPEDVFQVLIGKGDVGAEIVNLPLSGLFFTGSYHTGKTIAQQAYPHLSRLTLELGGKDPAYICQDVDIEDLVPRIADGCFYNAGQSCCAIERLYVHNDIHDEFIEALVAHTQNLVVGDPKSVDTYMGPLARQEQCDFLRAQILDADHKGARLVYDDQETKPDKGWYFNPTIISQVDHSMQLMQSESFGPIIGIQKVGGDEEAIELMNQTSFGLTASVHTDDEKRPCEILKKMNTGTVYWNCCDRVSPYLPWSGRKNSGVGSTLSDIGIQAFLQPKAWHMKPHR